VTVSFGRPLPPETPPFEVRRTVQELGSDAWRWRKKRTPTLHRAFAVAARRHPRRFAMADSRVGRLRFGAALTRTIFLARRLRSVWREEPMVGILLPPSVPGALVNLAALLSGKVPVNLNYTVSSETLASCVRQCGITRIVSSKAFLERMPVELPFPAVMIEDVAAGPRPVERLIALLMAWTLPAGLLERALAARREGAAARSGSEARSGRTVEEDGLPGSFPGTSGAPAPSDSTREEGAPRGRTREAWRPPDDIPLPRPGRVRIDDLATVIFSSGSTGDPKGVMLTHFNIAANVEQLGQSFALERGDRLLGVLPFFHSFGFTGTLILPATLGLGVVYHPSPLDARAIGALASEYAVTFLVATPTFLQVYVRGCAPEEFGSLQLVLAGAEKLSERVASAFEERFGIRPMEGYGSTECSPAITINTRDFRAAGFRQVGAKRGKIGHPLPGVSVRVVDPETMQPVPVGQPGLLLVRGPNVMKGYLGRPEQTAEVLRDGWYITGDIASEDEDGFLQITDRLSRFSKIGGEMVPHIRVEEALHELAGKTEQTFAVAGVPDERKGERLVVLHTLSEDELRECLEKLPRAGLPNLWVPRPDAFHRVEKLPYLGTGKLDLRKIRELALELSAAARG
jgi:acyl-[acyl-carrier-protein]-phospholipid O-acyltransferase/long-chain-fatty-acid--[acyl-carrier-protein] ligase